MSDDSTAREGEDIFMRALLVLMAIMFSASLVEADKVVRDRYGNIVETWHRRGNETEVRDRYGNLEETRTRRGNEIQVRDRWGNTIGTEKYEE